MPDPDPAFETPLPVWAPDVEAVRDEMPGRKAALDRVEGIDAEITELIDRRVRVLQAEIPAVLRAALHAPARDYVIYSVAAILEDRLFPQQAAMDGSNAQRLDMRAGAELARLRTQLGEDAASGASHWSGTVSMGGTGGLPVGGHHRPFW